MSWKLDKAWSDLYLPAVKRILGEHLICAAPEVEDQTRNTDLVVLRMDAIRIGCRIRRSKFYDNPRYRSQFTIRSARPGNETELSKILAGWGDYIFYGFADDAGGLLGYMLGDLYKFRGWYAGQLQSGCSVGSIHVNGDGSSQFMAFCWAEIPGFVVATDGLRGDLSPCLATARAGR